MTEARTADLIAVTMPKWGIEMAEGTIAEWMVEEGGAVAKGQVIAAIETDKISNEFESEWSGTLLRRVADVGATVPVGALIAVIGPADSPADAVDAFVKSFVAADTAFEPADSKPRPAERNEAPAPAAAPAAPASAPAPAPKRYEIPEGIAISPRARELAESRGLALEGVAGSGRKGRITLQDVEQLARPARSLRPVGPLPLPPEDDGVNATPLARREAARLGVAFDGIAGQGRKGRIRRGDVLAKAPAAARGVAGDNVPEVIRFTAMRRAVAQRLTESVNTVPHFYLRTEANVDWLLAVREKVNRERGLKLSINDFIVKAVANALMAVPDCNVNVFDNEIHRFPHADVAVAVALDGGLLTPVVRNADQKPIDVISDEIRELAERARANKLMPEDYRGGTFTVSNLGMYGLTGFDAIINPPQGAILAVGAVRRVPREQNFALVFPSVIEMTMSCDHRAIDGALGARFLAALREELEHPAGLVDNL